MYYPKPIKSIKKIQKRVCIQCGKTYEKNPKASIAQWRVNKLCSPKCSGLYRTKKDGFKNKYERYTRKNGGLKKSSPEWIERIRATTKEAMYRPEVNEKLRKSRVPLTKEHRDKIADAMKGKMPAFIPRKYGKENHFFGKPWTKQMKKDQSDKLAGKMPKNMIANGRYPNVKRGHYDINGKNIYFRSMWEANYALYLDFLVSQGELQGWDYEPETFIFEKIDFGTRSYTPDFRIIENNNDVTFHEVKGFMDGKSKTKLRRMIKYYPDVKLILIDRPVYMDIVKKMGRLLGFYDNNK